MPAEYGFLLILFLFLPPPFGTYSAFPFGPGWGTLILGFLFFLVFSLGSNHMFFLWKRA